MFIAALTHVSLGQKVRGRGPGGGAGTTRPAGGPTSARKPGKKSRPAKARPAKARSARAVAAKGATRRVEPEQRPRRPATWINRLLILAGAAIVVAAGARAYLTLQAIPVQRITVTGELAYTQREAVQEMVQPALAGGFLGADLEGMRAQLESLPWIYRATVRRRWPAALEIHVVEQLPIARWGEDGFLNHEGDIFRSSRSAEWQELPLLRGPEGTARSLMATYSRMVDILTPLGLAIEQLAVDELGQVAAELAGGGRLLLGSEDFLPRMHRFVELYRRELASRGAAVERVDLRYPAGAAVAFAEPEQMAGL